VSRRAPRSIATLVGNLTATLAPASLLARVQEVWPVAAGSVIAAEATPVAERDGILTISCRAAVWAQELDLMAGEIIPRLNAQLGSEAIRELRCRTV
jgi:predicted nucleic acid-binding Zn ribbon protein